MKTLFFAVRNLCCKPQAIKKISIFALFAAVSVIVTHLLSGSVEQAVLVFLIKWLWLPLSITYMICGYGEPIKRYCLNSFFHQIKFRDIDGKLPRYVKRSTINVYLKKIEFKAKIPFAEWEKVKADIEVFYRRKIFAIEGGKDMRKIAIYLIDQELPHFIEWRDEFMVDGRNFAIGESYKGAVVWDAANLAHGLVAGSTGSGKTALLRCIIYQAIQKKFNISVLDFKGGGDYSGIEHEARKYHDLENGYGPFLISEPERAQELLLALTIEVKSRLDCFKQCGAANIDEYNARGREQFLPWLIVIDEAAEILDVKPKDKAEKEMYAEIDQHLRSLARMSRAAGVHILMGFIRPSHEVLNGQIKNNLLWRVCGYFADSAASRIVLDNDRATELPPEIKGRFIIGEEEVQAYYLPVPPVISVDSD